MHIQVCIMFMKCPKCYIRVSHKPAFLPSRRFRSSKDEERVVSSEEKNIQACNRCICYLRITLTRIFMSAQY